MFDETDDAIDLLTRDHRMLERLLEQLDSENARARLWELFARISLELAAHEAAEQQIVFPMFRAVVPAKEREALCRLGEHEEINELLAEMRVLTPDDSGFDKRVGALCLELQAHFAAEEDEIFPCLEASMSHSDLVALGERVLAVKEAAPAFPEPEFAAHVHAIRMPRGHQ